MLQSAGQMHTRHQAMELRELSIGASCPGKDFVFKFKDWFYSTLVWAIPPPQFVVMVTPEDMKANAEYFKMADHVCRVPGGANNNNYANVELILDIAKR